MQSLNRNGEHTQSNIIVPVLVGGPLLAMAWRFWLAMAWRLWLVLAGFRWFWLALAALR